ncbi:hypothetical protein LK08_19220 [Streptomyces sp. MUSC 125]|nr:hypothetical protein LK08_19220 [Streptomyces sp. MUSC 125]
MAPVEPLVVLGLFEVGVVGVRRFTEGRQHLPGAEARNVGEEEQPFWRPGTVMTPTLLASVSVGG